MIHYEILEGPGNADRFQRFIDQLAHKCEVQRLQNCILILDNVPFHRTQAVQTMMQIRGLEYKYLQHIRHTLTQ